MQKLFSTNSSLDSIYSSLKFLGMQVLVLILRGAIYRTEGLS